VDSGGPENHNSDQGENVAVARGRREKRSHDTDAIMQARHLVLLALCAVHLVIASEDEMGSPPGGYNYGEDGDYPGEGDYPGDEMDGMGGMGDMGGEMGDEPPQGGAGVQELGTVEEFEAFIDNKDASVIGAFAAMEVKDQAASIPEGWDEEEDGEWAAPMIPNPSVGAFNEAASRAYSVRYAVTYEPEVLARLKSKSGGVYLYRSPKFVSTESGDRPRERYPATKINADALFNFVSAKAQPLVGLFSSATADRYKTPTLVIFMNLDFESNPKGVNYVLKRARKAAAGSLKGKMAIALGSSSEDSYLLSDFGLESKSPKSEILMGIRDGGHTYYQQPAGTAFSAATMQKFADDFLGGKLTPYEKPPPADEPDAGGDDDGMDGADGEDAEHDEP
jgi:hypothetical protein